MTDLSSEHPFAQKHAKVRKKYSSYRHKRKLCECGQPAVRPFAGSFVCERCYELDHVRFDYRSKMHGECFPKEDINYQPPFGMQL